MTIPQGNKANDCSFVLNSLPNILSPQLDFVMMTCLSYFRSSERYDSDLDEMCNRPRPNDELPHNGLLLTTNLSTEDLTKERRQHFRQHKVSNPNNGGEESCDSGDYFFSLSKDMKTMRAIPVSEL